MDKEMAPAAMVMRLQEITMREEVREAGVLLCLPARGGRCAEACARLICRGGGRQASPREETMARWRVGRVSARSARARALRRP